MYSGLGSAIWTTSSSFSGLLQPPAFMCSLKAGSFLVISVISLPSMVPERERVLCSDSIPRLGVCGGKRKKPCSSGFRFKSSFPSPDVFSYLKCSLWRWWSMRVWLRLCQLQRQILLNSDLFPGETRVLPFPEARVVRRHFPIKMSPCSKGREHFLWPSM